MCVVSMIMDHYCEKWYPQIPVQPYGFPYIAPSPSPITPAEIEEFRKLLERAREYDRKHNEPDCELEEKKQKIKDLARLLGVDVAFIDAVPSGTS